MEPFLWIGGYLLVGVVSVPLFDAFDDRILGRYSDERNVAWHVFTWPVTLTFVAAWTIICLIGIGVYFACRALFQKERNTT